MELKTLKDLKCVKDEEFSCCEGDKLKHERKECGIYDKGPWTKDFDLKQEAIKHIKAKQEAMKNYENAEYGTTGWMAKECLKSTIFFIKDFFNITKEVIQN